MTTATTTSSIKPFFKCVGGKSRVLSTLLTHCPPPSEYDAYYEPFLGGGALFLALAGRGDLAGKSVYLNDADPEVMRLFSAVRDNPDGLFAQLLALQTSYNESSPARREAMFYVNRDRFNGGERTAARALFLRATAFNGLWRMNRRGALNSPWGKYERIAVPSLQQLRTIRAALQNATLCTGSYQQLFAPPYPDVRRALVYFDPPYDGAFDAYTKDGFSQEDQAALIQCASDLHADGSHVLYSNSNTEFIAATLAATWPNGTPFALTSRHSVAAQTASRQDVTEFLVVGAQLHVSTSNLVEGQRGTTLGGDDRTTTPPA